MRRCPSVGKPLCASSIGRSQELGTPGLQGREAASDLAAAAAGIFMYVGAVVIPDVQHGDRITIDGHGRMQARRTAKDFALVTLPSISASGQARAAKCRSSTRHIALRLDEFIASNREAGRVLLHIHMRPAMHEMHLR